MQKEIGVTQEIIVEAMWKMLQQKTPTDYVIATGKQYSVKDFVNLVLKRIRK